ncbi:MAG TPA: choice-of-anchor tandem repeat GloVer-containing protein [Candidatus Cybelea sp.]|nr:choice-of-anchor tandem repeat GloVer-containing protein [Candidatus Cybelea sp.]
MRVLTISPCALSISVAAALLAACGGSQPPVGTAGAMPQQESPIVMTHTHMRRNLRELPFKVLGSLRPTDGEHPDAGLVNVHGTFYGTTSDGDGKGCYGSNGCGTVFSVSTVGSVKVLHQFRSGSDGNHPYAPLIDVNGTLYGTTTQGGSSGGCCGTVYRISTTGSERVIYSFKAGSDGSYPTAGLINVKGTLYGTTAYGGSGCGGYGCGTVYSISTKGAERVLHSFTGGSDGSTPQAGLLNVDGTLYGATYLGGSKRCYGGNGCGAIFSIDTKGAEKVLYSFKGTPDGAYPIADLISVNGILYGTTSQGGFHNYGTAYSISVAGAEKVLHRFGHGSDGWSPQASLINVNGTLYGTTWQGGTSNNGTIYRMSTTGVESVSHSFTGGPGGGEPDGAWINVNGTLYSTSTYGGVGPKTCCGTVFAFSP